MGITQETDTTTVISFFKCLQHPHHLWVEHVAITSNGGYFATAAGYIIYIWNTKTLALQATLEHNSVVWKCVFTHNQENLCAATSEGQLYIWNTVWDDSSGSIDIKPVPSLLIDVHLSCVFSCSVHPSEPVIATCGIHKHISLFHMETGICIKTLKGHNNTIEDVTFSHDGKFLASCSKDRTIRVWKHDAKEQDYQPIILKGHKNWVLSSVFSQDDAYLVTTSSDKNIGVWNMKGDINLLHFISGHVNIIWSSCLIESPILTDHVVIMTCSSDKTCRLWDLKSGQQLEQQGCLGGIQDGRAQLLTCAFCQSTGCIVAGDYQGALHIGSIDFKALTSKLELSASTSVNAANIIPAPVL